MILSYELETSLSGHIDSINTLQFSPTGTYLATGGQDGQLFILSTGNWRVVRKYADSSPLSSLVWHPTYPKTVICGFANGDLVTVCFDGDVDASDERTWIDNLSDAIGCITLDPLGTTIAIGHGGKVSVIEQTTISVWRNIRVIPDPPAFENVKEKLAAPIARSLHFLQDKDSLVASYFEHGVICWDVRSMAMKWKIVPRTRYIGRSSVSPDERFIVVSNLFDGLDWYSLADRTIRHTIPIHINPQMNLPVPVIFTKDGDAVVVGGTSRNARVLDSRTSETTQLLPHDGDIIQAIGVFDHEDGNRTIVTGVSEIGPKTTIKVWRGRDNVVGIPDESGNREGNVSTHTNIREKSWQKHLSSAASFIIMLAAAYLLSQLADPVQLVNSTVAIFLDHIYGTGDNAVPRYGTGDNTGPRRYGTGDNTGSRRHGTGDSTVSRQHRSGV